MYEKILSPINYGGVILKNRIIFAPTTMGLKDKDFKEEIRRLAEGGVGMIIIGDVPVGKSAFAKSIDNKKNLKFYKEVVEIAHSYGAKISAQLHMDDSDLLGMLFSMPKMIKHHSMSDIRRLMNDLTSNYISKMKITKIRKIIDAFGATAIKCKAAGFDEVQIHGDRMCGSFSSALINKRNDIYGGSVENRMRFAIESIESVKRAVPDMPIDYKLAIRIEEPHYGNAGVLFSEIKDFVPALERAGVNSFHIALANHSDLNDTIPPINHPYFKEEGCFLSFCDEVKKYTSLPICGVGALIHPDFIEMTIEDGRIDCAGMSRELIREPNYVYKLMNNKQNEIGYCVRCNKGCLGGVFNHTGIHCIFDK